MVGAMTTWRVTIPSRAARAAPHVARATCCALLLVALAGLAACGGSGTPKANGVTHASYVKEVDALCMRVSVRSQPVNRKIQGLIDGDGSLVARLKAGAPLLAQTYRLQLAKLKRFKGFAQPPGDRGAIADITSAAEGALKDLHGAIAIAARGDLASFVDFATDATGNRSKVERLGDDYGLRDDCFTLPVKL